MSSKRAGVFESRLQVYYKIRRLAHHKFTNAVRRRKDREIGVSGYESTDMSSRIQAFWHGCHLQFLRQMRSVKIFFLVSCTSFALFLYWVQLATRPDEPKTQNFGRNYTYKDVYKYILLWTPNYYFPFSYFGEGQRAFLEKNCSVIKCYVTSNRKFFGGDLTKFDAIAFNGRIMKVDELPRARSSHQRYIFFNTESADNFPVCNAKFDRFFNWTSTYRLDSDIPYPYILIRDKEGKTVGPKRKMQWKKDIQSTVTVEDDFVDRNTLPNKTKAAAWFVSNCETRSGRVSYVKALRNALKPYGLTVDVYGMCGNLQCPSVGLPNCNYLLRNDYYFYMSMENSFDEDYVTEKLLTALQNDVVPIVYGGADYSRFLPPGSYIDGRKQHVMKLAAMMNKLIHSPKEYNKYFRWKRHYTYHNPLFVENVCAMCEALHNQKMLQKTSIYDDFRQWWNPYYKIRCPADKRY